jgi:pimeloyl-ACP methyl ester carboxylesterase
VPIASVNGVSLYYEEYGDGPPILGIHGTPSSVLLWVDAARRLAQRGRCIVYERRGYPLSGGAAGIDRLDLGDHVDDAAALLEALSAVPAVLVGRSTGGQIALELARRRPDLVRALVLLEPALVSIDPEAAAWAESMRSRALRRAAEDPSAAAEAVVREALGDDLWFSLPHEVQELFRRASPAVLAESRGLGLDLSHDPGLMSHGELHSIHQPTLLVYGSSSPIAFERVVERLAEALPNAETERVSGSHLIDPAHPAVLEFLSRVPTAGS